MQLCKDCNFLVSGSSPRFPPKATALLAEVKAEFSTAWCEAKQDAYD
jgi:hypothetical protein